jgi:zinc transport system substrate-binding protein
MTDAMNRRTIFLCATFVAVVFAQAPAYVGPQLSSDHKAKIKVFVSILPQAYFVERVGGDRVDVSVMVGPGHSPATYEPRPKQMADLSKAKLYFRIGVPFESIWIERITRTNPHMKVIDTRRGIDLLPMKAHRHANHEGHHHHDKGIQDPHIWLSLRLVKIQAENICHALIAQDPAHKSYYEDNLISFHHDLDKLDAEIVEIVEDPKTHLFLVFHPAWGYFAYDYGLEQVPIEVEGKEPGAMTLAHFIKQAKQEGSKVIFVQQQFSEKSADTVAHAIGGKVIQIDPLAKDYLKNMKKIAETFAKVIQ